MDWFYSINNLYIKPNVQPYIESYLDQYKNFSDEYKDKEIEDWFLLESPWPTIAITVFYLLLVTKILPNYMKKRKEYVLRFPIFLYNLIAVLMNIYIIYKLINIKINNNNSISICSNVKPRGDTEASKETRRIVYLFYITKLIELLDTVFYLLRKRFHRLTFLHIYHHSTMFFLWWIGVNFYADGYTAIPVLFNSIVHAIMYTYYLLSSIGFQKWLWWKRYLTMIQMLQFCILITISTFLLRDQTCEYKISDKIIWFGIYYSLSHLIIFFYSHIPSYYGVKIENSKNLSDKSFDISKLSSSYDLNSNEFKENINESKIDDSILDRSEYRFSASKRRPLRTP